MLLRALLADASAWELVSFPARRGSAGRIARLYPKLA
jgi:hypothetical protein